MAENVELQFLGEQIARLQSDVRDVKARVLLVENDQSQLREEVGRLDRKLGALSERVENRFDQVEERFDRFGNRLDLAFQALGQQLDGSRAEIRALKQP